MDAINEASRNVSILLNRKMQIAPQLIKTIRKQSESDENLNNVINIVTTYEIWQVYLEYEKTNMNSCYVVISGDYTAHGYKKGTWSNIKYNGFYSLLDEAENEISGYLN